MITARDNCQSLMFMFRFGDNERRLKNMIKFVFSKRIYRIFLYPHMLKLNAVAKVTVLGKLRWYFKCALKALESRSSKEISEEQYKLYG